MTLGLKIGSVALSPHDPGWTDEYAREAAKLRRMLGRRIVAMEHVGSTAVPGLQAKPIIDVVIGTRSPNRIPTWAARLKRRGYVYFGDQTNRGDHFFAKTKGGVETIYLHVVRAGSPNWRGYVVFRDRLRRNPALRRQYGKWKETLAGIYPEARGAYARGKRRFFTGRQNRSSWGTLGHAFLPTASPRRFPQGEATGEV
jgi:GrpB-like predicted nucleotidyltransferase (UPF0157 family)